MAFANRSPIVGASRLPRSFNGRSLSGNVVSSRLDFACRTRNMVFMLLAVQAESSNAPLRGADRNQYISDSSFPRVVGQLAVGITRASADSRPEKGLSMSWSC